MIEKGEKEGYIRKNVKFFPKVRQFCNLGGGGSKTFCVRRVSMILGLGTEINVYPLPPIIQDSPPSPPYNNNLM